MPDTLILIVAAGAVVGTTILLAIGLAAGYWAGFQAAAHGDDGGGDELTKLRSAFANCQSQLATLNSGIQASHELSEVIGLLAQSARPPLSSELSAAIDRMIRSVRALEKTIHVLQETEASQFINLPVPAREPFADQPPPTPLRVVDDDEAPDPKLTTQEMHDLVGSGGRLADSGLDTESRSYPYDCIQQLAPWAEGTPLPESVRFTSVRCHRISVRGVSFLWDAIPHFTQAIFCIRSQQAPLYMVLRVVCYKAVYKHGSVRQLVECDFVGRLEQVTEEWAEQEAIAASS